MLRISSESGLAAAQQYASYKRRHLDTHKMCEAAGLALEPIVFESTGGLEPEAAGVLDSLLGMLVESTGETFATAKSKLMRRISLILVRSHHRALTRRRGQLGYPVASEDLEKVPRIWEGEAPGGPR